MKVKKLHPNAQLPKRARRDDQTIGIAYDLFAPEAGLINGLSRLLIPLGFAAEFPEGYAALLFDRSSFGNKGITRFGGVIDPSFRGEWAAILYNSNPATFTWHAGDRICQVLFVKAEFFEPQWADSLSESSRAGGCGSTGK